MVFTFYEARTSYAGY